MTIFWGISGLGRLAWRNYGPSWSSTADHCPRNNHQPLPALSTTKTTPLHPLPVKLNLPYQKLPIYHSISSSALSTNNVLPPITALSTIPYLPHPRNHPLTFQRLLLNYYQPNQPRPMNYPSPLSPLPSQPLPLNQCSINNNSSTTHHSSSSTTNHIPTTPFNRCHINHSCLTTTNQRNCNILQCLTNQSTLSINHSSQYWCHINHYNPYPNQIPLLHYNTLPLL